MRAQGMPGRLVAAVVLVGIVAGCAPGPSPTLSLPPSAAAGPTTAPSATPAPPVLSWTEVPLAGDTFDGAVVMRLVAGSGLVIAFGRDRATLAPLVWTSPDGRAWVRRPQPPDVFGGGVPDAAIVTSRGAAALGWGPDPAVRRREIWTSPDGAAWTRTASASGRLVDVTLSFAASGGTVLAAGAAGRRGVLLRSTDLEHWVDLSESPILDPDRGALVLATASGFAALRTGEHLLTAWSSVDGERWTQTGSLIDAWAGVAAWTPGGIAVIGSDNSSGTTTGGSWSSPDGRTWQPGPDVSDGAMGDFRSTLLAIDGGVVGLAMAPDPVPTGTPAGPTVVVSRDLRTWQRLPFPVPDVVVASLRDLAVAVDGHVLVLGRDPATGRLRAWEGAFAGGPAPTATGASPGPTSTGASPRPTAAPAVSAASLVWRPVDATATFGGGLVSAQLARLDGRLVVVARRGSRLHAWVSADHGLRWQEAADQPAFAGGMIHGLEQVGDRLVGVGAMDGPDGTTTPVSWTTRDGLSWTRLAVGGTGAMTAVAARGDTIVAVGHDGDDEHAAASWISTDGLRWVRTGGAWTPEGGSLSVVIAGPSGWIAGGATARTPMIWTSPDGVAWTQVADTGAFRVPGADFYGQGAISGLAATGHGLVAVGTVAFGGIWAEPVGAVFTSPDGLAWTRLPDDDRIRAVWPAAVAVSAARLAFVGAGRVGDGGAWTSPDGAAWSPSDALDMNGGNASAVLSFADLAADGDRFVALGSRDSRPTLWFAVPAGTVLPEHTCGAPPATLAALAAMPDADRVACLAGTQVSVDAWTRYWPAQGASVPPKPIYPGLTVSDVEGGRTLLMITLGPGSPASTVERDGRFRLRLEFGRVPESCVPAADALSPYVLTSEPAAWLRFACAAEPQLVGASRLP